MISGKADKFPLIELRELKAKTIINLADSPDIKKPKDGTLLEGQSAIT